MTRKDYKIIAGSLKTTYEFYVDNGGNDQERSRARTAVYKAAKDLADQLAKDNERFNYGKFIEACGVV